MPDSKSSAASLYVAPRRRLTSGKCLLYTFLGVTVALVPLFNITWGAFSDIYWPHAWVYQNATLEETANRSTVVQPLIDGAQRFDIVASIWSTDGPVPGGNERVVEYWRFSEVVFRNVTLKDKNITTEVRFRVPTFPFKLWGDLRAGLSNFNVRASFALIPSSPSLLDKVVDFTTWIPQPILVNSPPVLEAPYDRPSSLLDEVSNYYGAHAPLVEFHPNEGCNPAALNSNSDGDRSYVFKTDERCSVLGECTPYIVTRTDIRVIDFTHILNFEQFNKTLWEYNRNSCGQDDPDVSVSAWRYCLEEDALSDTGFWKTTLLQLGIPDVASGENKTEWAYAPYLSARNDARSPEDLVRVPMEWEEDYDIFNIEYVNVTWKLTYSGVTPAKLWLEGVLDSLGNVLQPDPDSKEDQNGHSPSEEARTSTRLEPIVKILDNINVMTGSSEKILSFLYWYTRVSSVGISISGVLLTTVSECILRMYAGTQVANLSASHNGSFWFYFYTVILTVGPFWIITILCKLRVMIRLHVQWRSAFSLPKITRVPASHAERASMRMDAKLPWAIKCTGIIILTLLCAYVEMDKEGSWRASDLPLYWTIPGLAVNYIHLMGTISQISLNHRSQSFASMFKLAAYLMLFDSLSGCSIHFPLLGTHVYNKERVLLYSVSTPVWLVMSYQALRYPYAKNNVDDED